MDWIRGERLGHGSFATVSLAVAKNNGEVILPLMAVKSCGAARSSSLVNERAILEELKDCPEIIRCFGDGFSYENGEELYNVLLEYAPGGSLADRVGICGDRRLPECEVRRYTRALLRGLKYIHDFGYVHCDIKLDNILVDSAGGVRIADFGLAKRGEGKIAADLRGTPLYMSPEMVAGGEQGTPADVWALGCAVSEMIAGSPAWGRSDDFTALLMRIGAGEDAPEIPGFLSEEGKDFLRQCFVKDPRERWTVEMLLRHPFVSAQDSDEDIREHVAAVSPRCPFEFPDWTASPATCSSTSFPSSLNSPASGDSWLSSISAAERLREMVTEESLNWSVTDDWVTVR